MGMRVGLVFLLLLRVAASLEGKECSVLSSNGEACNSNQTHCERATEKETNVGSVDAGNGKDQDHGGGDDDEEIDEHDEDYEGP